MQGTMAWPAVAVTVVAVAVGGNGFTAPSSSSGARGAAKVARREAARRRASRALQRRIVAAQRDTWRWQRVMGRALTRRVYLGRHTAGLGYRQWLLQLWSARAEAARRRAQHPPHLNAWLCIHRHEGGWRDRDGPYYGGLQMDLGFQRSYGPTLLTRKGTADHWTPLEQMWVAERAYASGRGFYPWPNTARWCGLI